MKKKKYYAVAGFNGYGVYDNYDKVLRSRKYITGFKEKVFYNRKTAWKYARKFYYEAQLEKPDDFHPVKFSSSYGNMNWFNFIDREVVLPFIRLN